MSAPCGCYYHKRKEPLLERQTSQASLDEALNELGMLSTVTNSRCEYLKEKLKESCEISAGSLLHPICILQMNSNFVTNFAFSACDPEPKSATAASSFQLSEFTAKKCALRRKRRAVRATPYHRRPLKSASATVTLRDVRDATSSTSSDSNSTSTEVSGSISRQDSGNKSNPGSPVKSQNGVKSSRCSIVRSRSLDDLEISNLTLSDCCGNEAGKAEIDTVSQRISNLHVS